MADPQEIQAARERVKALRQQLRQEQGQNASAAGDAAKDAQLARLQQEERSLELQLEAVRDTAPPDAASIPGGGVPGLPPEGMPLESVPEGTAFVETVDAFGTLVRTPVGESEQSASQPAQTAESGAE